jgi:vacuolar protein sorting-associated protein 52
MLIKTKHGIPESRALVEVRPELEKLKFKVCARARNFIIAKLNNLKKPKSNFQIYQQNILVKFKPLVVFLREFHSETYVELTTLYSAMMDEVYYSQLKQYFTDTAKLIRPIPKSSDLLMAVERAEVQDSLGGTP